jgi:ABC-type Zn uptake system ZnuABC Zn-binding protein ZnuA
MMKPSAFAGQTAGSIVEALRLVPPSGDFHAAKPSPSAASSVVHSDLASPLGLGRCGWEEGQ